jgi:hypothetical protein
MDGSSDNPQIPEEVDWEQWPEKRAELVQALKGMKQQFEEFQGRPELEPLMSAAKKFLSDMDNVLRAGDAEYRRLHPGAQFDPS